MSVQVPHWPFHINQRKDKVLVQGEWHFIYSAVSLFPDEHLYFLLFIALTFCPQWTTILRLILCYLHFLLWAQVCPEDTVHEITDYLWWSDEDREAGCQLRAVSLSQTPRFRNLGSSENAKVSEWLLNTESSSPVLVRSLNISTFSYSWNKNKNNNGWVWIWNEFLIVIQEAVKTRFDIKDRDTWDVEQLLWKVSWCYVITTHRRCKEENVKQIYSFIWFFYLFKMIPISCLHHNTILHP